MVWEIVSYGNGELLVSLLNGLKLMLQGPYTSLLLAVALGAVAVTIWRAAFGDDRDIVPGATILKTLGVAVLVFYTAIQIKVDVAVTDLLHPVMPEQVITGVPVALAVPMVLQSRVSDVMTTATEAAFSAPTGMSMREGLVRQQLELQTILDAKLPAGDARQTLTGYLVDCVFPNISTDTGLLSETAVSTAVDLLSAIEVANEAVRTTTLYQNGKVAKVVPCNQAFAGDPNQLDVSAIFNNPLCTNPALPCQDYKKILQDITGTTGQADITAMLEEIGLVVYNLLGISVPGNQVLQTVLILDVWDEAVSEAAVQSGNVSSVVDQLRQTLVRELAYSAYNQSWLASVWVPLTRSLGEGFVYVTAPFMLLMILGRGLGVTTQVYVMVFVWLALWGPLLALVNDMMMQYAIAKLHTLTLNATELSTWRASMVSAIADGSPGTGITMRTYDTIRTAVLTLNASALGLVQAVPLLAAGLVFAGGKAASSLVSALGQPTGGETARSAAQGRLESVQSEGPRQLITHNQATGLSTVADYQLGTQATYRRDGTALHRGAEGDYLTDRFGSVIQGTRVQQHADGSTVQATGHGSVERVVTVTKGPDGIARRTEASYNTVGGGRQLIAQESTFTQDGVSYRQEMGADGTVTETARGAKAIPLRTLGGDLRLTPVDLHEVTRIEGDGQSRTVRTDATFYSPTGSHTSQLLKQADGTYQEVAGLHKGTSEKTEIVYLDGEPVVARDQIDPHTGAVIASHYEHGTAGDNQNFAHTNPDGTRFEGKTQELRFGDHTIKTFSGLVVDSTGKGRQTSGLLVQDATGMHRVIRQESRSGIDQADEDRRRTTQENADDYTENGVRWTIQRDREGKIASHVGHSTVNGLDTQYTLAPDGSGTIVQRGAMLVPLRTTTGDTLFAPVKAEQAWYRRADGHLQLATMSGELVGDDGHTKLAFKQSKDGQAFEVVAGDTKGVFTKQIPAVGADGQPGVLNLMANKEGQILSSTLERGEVEHIKNFQEKVEGHQFNGSATRNLLPDGRRVTSFSGEVGMPDGRKLAGSHVLISTDAQGHSALTFLGGQAGKDVLTKDIDNLVKQRNKTDEALKTVSRGTIANDYDIKNSTYQRIHSKEEDQVVRGRMDIPGMGTVFGELHYDANGQEVGGTVSNLRHQRLGGWHTSLDVNGNEKREFHVEEADILPKTGEKVGTSNAISTDTRSYLGYQQELKKMFEQGKEHTLVEQLTRGYQAWAGRKFTLSDETNIRVTPFWNAVSPKRVEDMTEERAGFLIDAGAAVEGAETGAKIGRVLGKVGGGGGIVGRFSEVGGAVIGGLTGLGGDHFNVVEGEIRPNPLSYPVPASTPNTHDLNLPSTPAFTSEQQEQFRQKMFPIVPGRVDPPDSVLPKDLVTPTPQSR